jgi:hypothetical protein
VRLVAFMQYLRLVTAVVVATIVAGWWTGLAVPSGAPVAWFVMPDMLSLAATLVVIVLGLLLASRISLPMGSMLIPMVLGAVVNGSGVVSIELPPWLLAPSYAVVGWQVGSRFDRPIVLHAMRALPGLLAGTIGLVALCAGFAALLVVFAVMVGEASRYPRDSRLFPMLIGSGDDPIADAVNFNLKIGPAARAVRDAGIAAEARPLLAAALGPYLADDEVQLPGAIWLVTARA